MPVPSCFRRSRIGTAVYSAAERARRACSTPPDGSTRRRSAPPTGSDATPRSPTRAPEPQGAGPADASPPSARAPPTSHAVHPAVSVSKWPSTRTTALRLGRAETSGQSATSAEDWCEAPPAPALRVEGSDVRTLPHSCPSTDARAAREPISGRRGLLLVESDGRGCKAPGDPTPSGAPVSDGDPERLAGIRKGQRTGVRSIV